MLKSNYHRGTRDFLLSVRDSYETESSSRLGTLGEGTADAAYRVIPRPANSSEGETVCTYPETATAA